MMRTTGAWRPVTVAGAVALLALLAAGEAAAQEPEFEDGTCTYSVSPATKEFAAAGGTGRFSVSWTWTAPPPGSICIFNCSSDACGLHAGPYVLDSWITNANRQSNTVTYAVGRNTGGRRSGTVFFGDATHTVTQLSQCPDAPASVTPTSRTSPYQGETFDVSVVGRSDCSWAVSSNRSWISVGASSVNGGGTVSITLDPNISGQRSGTVSIGGRSVSITQPPPPCPASPTRVSPSPVTDGPGGGTMYISVEGRADCSWDVRDDGQGWFTASPSTVSDGGRVEVNVFDNGGPERRGTVTIGGLSVTVIQLQRECTSSPGNIRGLDDLGYGGGSYTVQVPGRAHCSWEVSEDVDWFSVSPSNVSGGDTLDIEVDGNDGERRTGWVAVGDASFRVEQLAAPCPRAPGVDPATVTFGADGTGAGGVAVSGSDHCGYDVEVSSGAAAWLSADVTRVAGGGTVEVSVTANSGPARSGTVTIGDASVAITQADGCSAAGSTASLSFGNGSGKKSATAGGSSACTFAVSDDRAWITVSASSVAGGGSVRVLVTANSGAERTGAVTIGTSRVAVTQTAAACPAAPGVNPAMVTFGADGAGAGGVAVGGSGHCGYDVEVSSGAAAWLNVDVTRVSGGETVTLSATVNTGGERTGTVTVGTSRVAVTQTAAACPAAPGVNPAAVTFGADGTGAGGVAVGGSGHCGYDVTVSSGAAAWLNVDVTRASGGDTVTLSATANSGAERRGTVTIGAASVQITQAAGCPASPGGVPGRLDYGSGAASRAVPLTEDAGCPYAVTKDADWITVEPASAAGNGTVTVSVAEHTGTVARTGTVTIGLQRVAVTQTGGCQAAPGVTVPLVAFGNGGGALPVGVGESSVCEYAVTADAAWVTVQPARVTGGGTVTVTVPEDLSGGGPRRGAVTIGAAGVRVAQGNTPPVAAADAVTTWRETATPVAVLANDTDADADPLAVAAVVTAPAQGTAAVSADGQTVTYTSAAGWAGDETFTYQVTDDVGGTAEAVVTVTVRAAAPFTDPVLTVGVTPIKAVHMTELRTAGRRGAGGLRADGGDLDRPAADGEGDADQGGAHDGVAGGGDGGVCGVRPDGAGVDRPGADGGGDADQGGAHDWSCARR